MRTKEEITKKKSLSTDGLDSTGEISTDKQLRKKRFYILLSIFLTIGLSLIFVIYRQVRLFIQNPKINLPALPKVNLTIPHQTNFNFTSIIADQIGPNNLDWNIVISETDKLYNWNHNKTVFNSTQAEKLVSEVKSKPATSIVGLPEGLIVHSSNTASNQLNTQNILINPPGRQILFSFQFNGSDQDFHSVLSKLIPALYWDIIRTPSN